MGDKSELLATVWQREGKNGPLQVTLTSDVAAALVLHWGVKRQGRGDWAKPPEALWPQGSTPATDTAVDTPFQVRGACGITVAGGFSESCSGVLSCLSEQVWQLQHP